MRRRRVAENVITVLLLVSCSACGFESNRERAAALADKGARAEQNGKLDQAEGFYTAAVAEAEHSDNGLQLPTYLCSLAKISRREKKYSQSAEAFSRAIEN